MLYFADPRHGLIDKCQVLQGGSHEYTFQYQLPRNLPSSFESEDPQFKGRVHYLLRAKLDSPEDCVRQHRDTIFIVLNTLDLNKEPGVSVSRHMDSCFCTNIYNVVCDIIGLITLEAFLIFPHMFMISSFILRVYIKASF